MKRRSLLYTLLAACAAQAAAAQAPPPRPVPNPVQPPRGYLQAVERGTRATSGQPGARYWQQWANYRIRATIDPTAKTLAGSQTVTYYNRSPDTLRTVVLKVYQNVHKGESVRNEPAEITGGMEFSRVAFNGAAVAPAQGRGPGYAVDGTRMLIRPASPVLPGDSVRLEFDFSFKIPKAGISGRMGYASDNLFYLAYFYPQLAVYDDVVGWHTDPFLGTAEFYMGYGNYEYTVDAPAGWAVSGTGALQTPERVLAPAILDRYRRAASSDTTVHVMTAADFGKATTAGTNGRVTWSFRADSVRDVAFLVTRESRWDAARTPVGDRNGDGRPDYTLIQSFWRESAPRWANAVRDAQQSITHHSQFTGVPYPYPHMTSIEADEIIGGGMEYPMMTIIGAYTQAGDTALYSVISHEIAHMWFPMVIGVDETRYGWMDEGTTDFNENAARADMFPGGGNPFVQEQRQYVGAVRNGVDGEMLRWTDFQTAQVGGFVTYTKPATVLFALRGLLGDEAFLRGYHAYARGWTYKHPKPWDFFNAFNTAAGRDLWWFWSTWYDNTFTLDQAVASVADGAGGTTITVQDRGTAPMPARLVITRQNGQTERREVPVDTWLSGARSATVTVPAGSSPVVKVEIDPESYFPDVDRANNVWNRG